MCAKLQYTTQHWTVQCWEVSKILVPTYVS